MMQETLQQVDFQVPAGFKEYLRDEKLPIIDSRNLLRELTFDSPEAQELASNLLVLHHLELEPEGTSRRDVVLMLDKEGNRSMVVVCRDMGNVIGGCGLYNTPLSEDPKFPIIPISYALEHTKRLSVIMRRKCWMAGLKTEELDMEKELDMGGMKATVPGESDWEKSEILQKATGFLFSRRGIFPDAITGTDARQTPDTIANMAKGSEIGGDHQIAGMIEALDTPGSCRYSLEQTYEALQNEAIYTTLRELYKEMFGKEVEDFDIVMPDLDGAIVLNEAFGRIGRTAARLMLDKGAKIIVSDPWLTNETDLLPKTDDPEALERQEATRRFVRGKLGQLARATRRVRVVKTYELADQKAQIFCPCADKEGLLDENKLRKLAANGVKVILSGANNPFGEEGLWQRARLAAMLGIIVLPEILANDGSVTAAAMEPILRAKMAEDPRLHHIELVLKRFGSSVSPEIREQWELHLKKVQKEFAEKFVHEYVVPHIKKNTRKKLELLIEIVREKKVDLYTAGEIAFRRAFKLPYTVSSEGILQQD